MEHTLRICETCKIKFEPKCGKVNRFCNAKCYNLWQKGNTVPPSRKGYKFSEEERLLHSQRLPKGEKHWHWEGGKSTENDIIRNSIEYKIWRTSIFERDDYTCQKCNKRNGHGKRVILHVHHIQQFAFYPELRLVMDNGITICKDCHLKIPRRYK